MFSSCNYTHSPPSPPGDNFHSDAVVPPSDHCSTETVLPTGERHLVFAETVAPSIDHYCIDIVASSSDHWGVVIRIRILIYLTHIQYIIAILT